MTVKRDQWSETVGLGPTHVPRVCAMLHAKGMMDGRIAASADAPEFLGIPAVLQTAWDVSHTQQKLVHHIQPEEYFVGWVQGYGQRTDEVRDKVWDKVQDETPDVTDTWEDEGGALAVSWLDA